MELRFLHLSDLHFKTTNRDPAAALGQDLVNTALLNTLSQLASKPDFIVVTGDIAFSAQREEYDLAAHFFERLLAAVELPKERLFMVPGNHDVDRHEVKANHVKRWYPFDTQEELTEILTDSDLFPILMRKFAPYRDFAFQATGRQLLDENTYHWSDTLHLEKGGRELSIRLLGLNSALMAGYDGDDEKQLAFGIAQVHDALGDGVDDAELNIGLHHHPFDCFHDCDEVNENKLKHGLDMILTGHLHEGRAAASHDASGTTALLAAGACFEQREHDNGFNEVRVDLTSGGGEVTFYKYHPDHDLWRTTPDRNPREEDGRFRFTLNSIAESPWPSTPEPTPPKSEPVPTTPAQAEPHLHLIHDYLLPNNFAGRTEEQARLMALAEGKPDPITGKRPGVVCLRAPGGVGKSCLARKHLEAVKASGLFPELLWFSFYEARTEEPTQFLRDALARLAPERLEGADSAEQLGKALRERLDTAPVFLLLDGLEVIQRTEAPNAPHYGHINETYREIHKLLTHLCNQGRSHVLVTSRVPLNQLRPAAGHLELALDTFGEADGIELLRGLEVEGSEGSLRCCVQLTGGHALALEAAGRWLAERRVDAANIEKLVSDPERFRATSEGEKVARIVDGYRDHLTPDQERFLRLMAIHPRAVGRHNFPLLVEGYDEEGRDDLWVADRIVRPLGQLGLLDILEEKGETAYHAHPLMKLAFSRWFDAEGVEPAHRQWAEAALASPDALISARKARSVAELQPLLDAVEHYLKIAAWREAWGLFSGRGLADRLEDLGQAARLLELGRRFETALEAGAWPATARERRNLYNNLGMAVHGLGRPEEALTYREMQYSAAREIGDPDYELADGAVFAATHLHIGDEGPARELLATLAPLEKQVTNPSFKAVHLELQAMSLLFAGEYAVSLPLYDQALEHASPHNKTVAQCDKSKALASLGRLKEARATLDRALTEAKKHHLDTLLPVIFGKITQLALKDGNLTTARDSESRRETIQNSLEEKPFEPDPYLLCAEGEFDRTIAQQTPYLSTPHDEKPNKRLEIEALLALAQARLGKGETKRAETHLRDARALMESTGCWRERDRLEETEAMLAEGRSPKLAP